MIKFYNNAMMTDKAFILYRNITHISWDIEPGDMVNLKVYSAGGKIIQMVTSSELEKFLRAYKEAYQ